MPITVSQISSLVGRYTNSVVNEQVNMECPFVGEGVIKRKKIKDKLGVVNIKGGELSSTSILSDGGTLPAGGSIQPVQGTYLPIPFFARVEIPRVAAKLASSLQDGINLVNEQMETCGSTLGRQLGRSVFVQSLGSPTATVNAASTTFSVTSAAGLRIGMGFEVWNGASPIEGQGADTLVVAAITAPLDGSNPVVTFVGTNAGGNLTQWLTTYTLYLRGARGNPMVSLSDVTAAASLYSVVHTARDWAGILDSTTTTLQTTSLRRMITAMARKRGRKPTHIVSNRLNEERYSNLLINNRRFTTGKMDAVGGAAFELEGIPWICDENVDDTDVFMFNDKDVLLHEFQDFEPELDGGKKGSMGWGAALISDTTLTYDVQVLGMFNLRVLRRNGTGRFSALTD
jgi:hypothetical protein